MYRPVANGSTPVVVFLMVATSDGTTAVTGLTPTVQISKNGGAFAAATNAPSAIGNGWYKLTLTAAETNTDGPLIIRATGTGALEWRDVCTVQDGTPDVNVVSVDGAVVVDANIVSEDGAYTPSAATLSTATKQSIADYVLSRTAAQLRAAGLMPSTEAEFRSSLIGAIFATAGVNYLSGGALITKDEAGNTAITRSAATNAGAEPITGLTVPS